MGSLSAALGSAVSGLRTTQSQIEIISGNVANSGTSGYTRRQANLVEQPSGDGSGVRLAGVQRALDGILQRDYRTETGASGYSAVLASYTDQLQKLFGTPGAAASVDGTYNAFTKSLQDLVSNPSDATTRSAAVNAASALAQKLNAVSANIQGLRQDAETQIDADVTKANALLQQISAADLRSQSAGGKDPALLDQRDAAINELAKLMDVQVTQTSQGGVDVKTKSGLTLYSNGQPTTLHFDPRGSIGPTSLYSTGSSRGVGTITVTDGQGQTIDLISQGMIRSGEIAGLVDMRDKALVEAQNQLDAFAAAMSKALSDKPVASTATAGLTAPSAGLDIDLTGLMAGNVVTVDTTATPGGTAQRYSFVVASAATTLTNAATPDPNDIVVKLDPTLPLGPQIQAALPTGMTATTSGNTLSVRYTTTSGPQLTGLSAAITNAQTTDAGTELPLFVDGGSGAVFSGSLNGGDQTLGYAARIRVNPQVLGDSSLLVRYATGSNATLAADNTRPSLLYTRLTKASTMFSTSTGIGQASAPYSGTVGSFLSQVVQTQATNASAAQNLDEGQKVVQSSLESRIAQISGVSVDSEMANLIQVQNAYAANARIVSAVKDMFDLLMRM